MAGPSPAVEDFLFLVGKPVDFKQGTFFGLKNISLDIQIQYLQRFGVLSIFLGLNTCLEYKLDDVVFCRKAVPFGKLKNGAMEKTQFDTVSRYIYYKACSKTE